MVHPRQSTNTILYASIADYETDRGEFEAKVRSVRAALGQDYATLGKPIVAESIDTGGSLHVFHVNVYTYDDPMNCPPLVGRGPWG